MKNLRKFSALLLVFTLFWSCDMDDDTNENEPTLNIVETAQANPDLSLLVEAVIQAGLVDALSAPGEMTLFAPDNDAFEELLDGVPLSEIPNDALTQLLLNHVIGGVNIESASLVGTTGYVTNLASGPNESNLSTFYNGLDGVEINGTSEVDEADILATNGIIHIVDSVIEIPTIPTFVAADPAFEILLQALTEGTPETDLVSILSAPSPFTILAPVNNAFVGVEIEDQPNTQNALLQILLHHVISNNNIRSENLSSSSTVETMYGPVTITVPGTDGNIADVVDGSGNNSGIIAVDVQASNGVIHAVNEVLIPSSPLVLE